MHVPPAGSISYKVPSAFCGVLYLEVEELVPIEKSPCCPPLVVSGTNTTDDGLPLNSSPVHIQSWPKKAYLDSIDPENIFGCVVLDPWYICPPCN